MILMALSVMVPPAVQPCVTVCAAEEETGQEEAGTEDGQAEEGPSSEAAEEGDENTGDTAAAAVPAAEEPGQAQTAAAPEEAPPAEEGSAEGEAGTEEEKAAEESAGTEEKAQQALPAGTKKPSVKTPVDDVKSGIIEVAIGYEFDDGSFDPWVTGAGFLISNDHALSLSGFVSLEKDSETYEAILNTRKSGYMALGIDISDYEIVQNHLNVSIFTQDGSRIRCSNVAPLEGTQAVLLTLTRQLPDVYTFKLGTEATFENNASSGYVAGYKKELLANMQIATIENVVIEDAKIHSNDGMELVFSSTADNGIAGGPIFNSDKTVLGICTGNSSGTGTAIDIRMLQGLIPSEGTGAVFDIPEKTTPVFLQTPYIYILAATAAVILAALAAVIGLVKKSRDTDEKPAAKRPAKKAGKKDRGEKPRASKKDAGKKAEPPEEEEDDGYDGEIPEETDTYDAEYIRQQRREEEARRRKQRAELEAYDDIDDGDDETEVLNTKRYPYLIREKTGERIDISKNNFVIGKSRIDADYCITGNKSISKKHCEIIFRGGRYYIDDLNSLNFTFVNDAKLNPGNYKPISDRTKIMMSDETFTFHMPAKAR